MQREKEGERLFAPRNWSALFRKGNPPALGLLHACSARPCNYCIHYSISKESGECQSSKILELTFLVSVLIRRSLLFVGFSLRQRRPSYTLHYSNLDSIGRLFTTLLFLSLTWGKREVGLPVFLKHTSICVANFLKKGPQKSKTKPYL